MNNAMHVNRQILRTGLLMNIRNFLYMEIVEGIAVVVKAFTLSSVMISLNSFDRLGAQ